MPARPLFRSARAVVFATVCVALAAAGHMAAGMPVAPGAAGTGLALVAGVALMLAGRERSIHTITGGLLGAQFGLHALFAQAGCTGAGYTGAGYTQAFGHHQPAEVLAPPPGGHPAMTAAHVGAALLTAWWLRRGEAALWTLARRIAAALRPPPPPVARHRVSPHVPSPPGEPALRRFLTPLRHVVILRGPPTELSALYV